MPVDVVTEVVIESPRAEVAAFMFDPRNDAAWTTGVIACRPLTEGPLRPGSKVERTVRFLGRQFSYVYEVTAAEADRFVQLRVENPFPMDVRYSLEDLGQGTKASIRASGEAGGFFRIAGPLLAGMVRRNIAKDLALLKRCVEERKAERKARQGR